LLLSKLIYTHVENSFRSKNYFVAAFKFEELTVDLYTLSEEDIFKINRTEEITGKKINEILSSGKMKFF
jgi:DNA polymerase/3'-5' exonuclease PolX